jgi:hypothetical protein
LRKHADNDNRSPMKLFSGSPGPSEAVEGINREESRYSPENCSSERVLHRRTAICVASLAVIFTVGKKPIRAFDVGCTMCSIALICDGLSAWLDGPTPSYSTLLGKGE